MKNKNEMLTEIADYYSGKLAEHGETARGVDWNGEGSQTLRFEQLCKVIDSESQYSINDIGCGYGALYDYLNQRKDSVSYLGIDVSKDMVKAATDRFKDQESARFIVSTAPDKIADYSVASGVFNVRLNRTDAEWRVYLEEFLEVLDQSSSKGFSFNCLTSYSDKPKMHEYLYYADPCQIFDLCKRRYSKNVALLHDYNLYEFTILVRK
jgi:SAM-dependent methyltransferase